MKENAVVWAAPALHFSPHYGSAAATPLTVSTHSNSRPEIPKWSFSLVQWRPSWICYHFITDIIYFCLDSSSYYELNSITTVSEKSLFLRTQSKKYMNPVPRNFRMIFSCHLFLYIFFLLFFHFIIITIDKMVYYYDMEGAQRVGSWYMAGQSHVASFSREFIYFVRSLWTFQ